MNFIVGVRFGDACTMTIIPACTCMYCGRSTCFYDVPSTCLAMTIVHDPRYCTRMYYGYSTCKSVPHPSLEHWVVHILMARSKHPQESSKIAPRLSKHSKKPPLGARLDQTTYPTHTHTHEQPRSKPCRAKMMTNMSLALTRKYVYQESMHRH